MKTVLGVGGLGLRVGAALACTVLAGPLIQTTFAAAGSAPMNTICFGKQATIVRLGVGATVTGTSHADVIVTGSGANVIEGRGGNDRICSGGGNDRISGGSGSDQIDVGQGEDVVEAGNGSDWVRGGPGHDTLLGERGNDLMDGGAGSRDFVDGGLGDDSLFGGAGNYDQVIGGVGNDELHGGQGNDDVLRGDHGSDLFDGGSGSHDTASFAVSGFTGANSFSGTGVTVNLSEGRATQDGNDHLRGIEDVIGSPFHDIIVGDRKPNVLYGAGGDDRLVASGSEDSAYGGRGSDACEGFVTQDSCGPEASGATPTVEVDLAGGVVGSSLTAVVRLPQLVPGLESKPEVANTSMHVSFEEGAWLLKEEPLPIVAGDSCVATGTFEARCVVAGKPDAAFLDGGSGDDLIEVESSSPSYVSTFIDGEGGADTLIGGSGEDNLSGAPAVSEHPTDALYGRGGDDSLANGALLDGGRGSDLLIAAPCDSQMVNGGGGMDSVSFARANGHLGVEATLGGAAVYASSLDSDPGRGAGCPSSEEEPTRIGGSVERIEGSRWSDVLRGNTGPNGLLGRGGNDLLEGGGGADTLVGGTGRDRLFGGAGFDRLYTADGSRDPAVDCGAPGLGVAIVNLTDAPPRHCSRISLR